MINPRDPSGRSPHLLVFHPSPEALGCDDYLRAIEEHWGEYERLGARVVVITADHVSADSPFAVIAEALDLFVRCGFMDQEGNPQGGLVIVDRYGQVDACYRAADFTDLPAPRVVLQRLESAESVCPECGVPEERWLEVV